MADDSQNEDVLLCCFEAEQRSTVFSALSEYLSTGQYVDISLVCKGQVLRAHKVVLSSSSKYFKDFFRLQPEVNIIDLDKELAPNDLSLTPEDVQLIIGILYCVGTLEILPARIETLLICAQVLGIPTLISFLKKIRESIKDNKEPQQSLEYSDHQLPFPGPGSRQSNKVSVIKSTTADPGQVKQQQQQKSPMQQQQQKSPMQQQQLVHSSDLSSPNSKEKIKLDEKEVSVLTGTPQSVFSSSMGGGQLVLTPQQFPAPLSHNSVPKVTYRGVDSMDSDKNRKRPRCGNCSGCLNLDCLQCRNCLDQKRYGGPGRLKKACNKRQCVMMTQLTASGAPSSASKADLSSSSTVGQVPLVSQLAMGVQPVMEYQKSAGGQQGEGGDAQPGAAAARREEQVPARPHQPLRPDLPAGRGAAPRPVEFQASKPDLSSGSTVGQVPHVSQQAMSVQPVMEYQESFKYSNWALPRSVAEELQQQIQKYSLPLYVDHLTAANNSCCFIGICQGLNRKDVAPHFAEEVRSRARHFDTVWLRNTVCDFITTSNNKKVETMKHFYERHMKFQKVKVTWKEMWIQMRQKNTWGNQHFIQAAAWFLNININIVTTDLKPTNKDQKMWNTYSGEWSGVEPIAPPLYLGLRNHSHFQALVPISSTIEGAFIERLKEAEKEVDIDIENECMDGGVQQPHAQ